MAGHSKWANIQHRKGRQDKLRSKLFSKLSKDITIAAKLGGGDIDANPRLRLAVSIAKGQSVPKDNIQRAIDKAAGGDADSYEDIRYEGFGPGGVGVIVEVSTDNRNRAAICELCELPVMANEQLDRRLKHWLRGPRARPLPAAS